MGNKWQDAIADSGDSLRRFKIVAPNDGDTTKVRIRIVSDNFQDAWVHYFPGFKEDGKAGTRFAVCLKKGKCPICAKHEETGDDDYKAKRQFYINVIDRKSENPKVMLWQCGFGMFKDIAGIIDEESGTGDPSEFDLVIKRTGKSKTNTRYAVKPFMKDGSIVKKKLPSDLLKLLDLKPEEGGPYDLAEFTKKKTADEMVEMLTGEFSSKSKKKKDDDEDEEDEKPKKKKKASDDDDDDEDDKPKKKKKDDDEDEDEDDKPKKKKYLDDDDDEDEDEKPKKKKKASDDDDEDDEDEKPKKKKKKDDDDDDEDEDEDDKPKKKKKSSDDEDDDEDEDDKPKKKKKSSDDDDDEEDDDEDEKPKKKKKKSSDDDDEDDD